MQSELKPCPFCGGEAKIISPLGWGNVRAVECGNSDNCAATGPWFSDEKHAIAAWNTRASDAEITRLTEALRLQMEAKHKEAAEAKLWFQKAQEWKEALRAAEEREKALLSALEEWMFRYFWRVDGMPVEAARIHAQSRMKIAALAGAKP